MFFAAGEPPAQRDRKQKSQQKRTTMSRHLNPCRRPERTATAAVQGMRAPAAVERRPEAKPQIMGCVPARGGDPMEVPD